METHRIKTRFGAVDVRVYRLKDGWWPVAMGGRHRLPADPSIAGARLPQSVGAAVQRMSEIIDRMASRRTQADERRG